ncbi:ROK family protein [Candidatus Saccharibacteria bacterium]|nr:ROK family protein [Candidatus Saccharibacteria bacterium]
MYLIIDIGGTKTLIALFNARGRIVKRYKFQTPTKKSEFLAILKSALVPFSITYRSKIRQIIIATPGVIKGNIATEFDSRPWKNIDLTTDLKNLFDSPITLKNDADLATVYESTPYKGLTLFLDFSTDIGGGLARHGVLTRNSATVRPGQIRYIFEGKNKKWGDIASCAALKSKYHSEATSIRGKSAYSDVAFRVSLGLPHLIQKYHPDTIIIGGPLAKQYPHIRSDLKKNIQAFLPRTKNLPRLTSAKRPLESVIYGGYLYAKKLKA